MVEVFIRIEFSTHSVCTLSLCRLSIHLFSSCVCLFVVCFPLLFLIFVVWSFAICAEPEHTRTTPSSGTVTGHMAAFKSRASVRWLSGCELRKSFCLPNTIIPTPASLRSPERSYSVSLSLSFSIRQPLAPHSITIRTWLASLPSQRKREIEKKRRKRKQVRAQHVKENIKLTTAGRWPTSYCDVIRLWRRKPLTAGQFSPA